MKMALTRMTAVGITLAWIGLGGASTQPSTQEQQSARIAWYATLESGLAEAARSNRPILLISAAPQCLGVPGTW